MKDRDGEKLFLKMLNKKRYSLLSTRKNTILTNGLNYSKYNWIGFISYCLHWKDLIIKDINDQIAKNDE